MLSWLGAAVRSADEKNRPGMMSLIASRISRRRTRRMARAQDGEWVRTFRKSVWVKNTKRLIKRLRFLVCWVLRLDPPSLRSKKREDSCHEERKNDYVLEGLCGCTSAYSAILLTEYIMPRCDIYGVTLWHICHKSGRIQMFLLILRGTATKENEDWPNACGRAVDLSILTGRKSLTYRR